jgi:arsenate reductase (thioredoxin)
MHLGRRGALAAVVSSALACESAPRAEAESDTVVFVCEHGSAKSLVAAQHFNRLAARRSLRLRAVARGVSPDATPPAPVLEGLRADGLAPTGFTPRRFETGEAAAARRVIVVGDAALPGESGARAQRWEKVPAVSTDYGAARDAIVREIESLLDQLERSGG